jgi:hypothetical protein
MGNVLVDQETTKSNEGKTKHDFLDTGMGGGINLLTDL